jgi:hypothetical protein
MTASSPPIRRIYHSTTPRLEDRAARRSGREGSHTIGASLPSTVHRGLNRLRMGDFTVSEPAPVTQNAGVQTPPSLTSGLPFPANELILAPAREFETAYQAVRHALEEEMNAR